MCVEKDERSTDSRVKTGIQNILGGVVLLSLPVVAISIIGMWGTLGVHSIQLKHQSKEHASMLRRIVLLEGFKHQPEDHSNILHRLELVEEFKSKTQSDRFRHSDGQRLEGRIDRIEEARHRHDTAAEGWITIIKRNTDIIKNNQVKAHTHDWRETKDLKNNR